MVRPRPLMRTQDTGRSNDGCGPPQPAQSETHEYFVGFLTYGRLQGNPATNDLVRAAPLRPGAYAILAANKPPRHRRVSTNFARAHLHPRDESGDKMACRRHGDLEPACEGCRAEVEPHREQAARDPHVLDDRRADRAGACRPTTMS
jgi:hypothetical protein